MIKAATVPQDGLSDRNSLVRVYVEPDPQPQNEIVEEHDEAGYFDLERRRQHMQIENVVDSAFGNHVTNYGVIIGDDMVEASAVVNSFYIRQLLEQKLRLEIGKVTNRKFHSNIRVERAGDRQADCR